MSAYEFNQQFEQGSQGETSLDKHFSYWYFVLPVPMAMQRLGVDRVFIHVDTLKMRLIEYKTDARAAQTGNVFIETVSVDRDGKPGWIYTSHADWLFYYLPQMQVCHLLEFTVLRTQLDHWLKHYPLKVIPNKGYNTKGIIVPLKQFAALGKSHSLKGV